MDTNNGKKTIPDSIARAQRLQELGNSRLPANCIREILMSEYPELRISARQSGIKQLCRDEAERRYQIMEGGNHGQA